MSTTDNRALLGAIISLFLPGIGLLLSKENKVKGVLIFVLALIADFLVVLFSTVLVICMIGVVMYLGVIIIHILACVHTYDTIIKEDKKGKPVIFQ